MSEPLWLGVGFAAGYLTLPSCPVCGEVVDQDWTDVTRIGDRHLEVLPGLCRCGTPGCEREGCWFA